MNPATGLFSGILTLSDENPDRAFLREARPITFQGVLLLDETIGTGYFLLNELSAPPPPPQKGLNAPVESLSFKASRR